MGSENTELKAQAALTLRVVLVWGVVLVVLFTVVPQAGYAFPSGPIAAVLRACIVVVLARGLYVSRKTGRERTARRVTAIVWMTVASVLAVCVVEGLVWFVLRLVLKV